MKKEITLILLLLLPPVVVYFSMKWTHDAVITIWSVTLLCYCFTCWLYDLAIGGFKWSWFVGKETTNFCSKVFDGIGFTLMFGVVTAAILICFSIFSPWGISKMVLPFPSFDNGWDIVYMVTFLISYLSLIHI